MRWANINLIPTGACSVVLLAMVAATWVAARAEGQRTVIVPSVVANGVTFVPLRSVLGEGDQLDWWPAKETAVLHHEQRVVLISPQTDSAWTPAGPVKLSVRPFLREGKLMVAMGDLPRLVGAQAGQGGQVHTPGARLSYTCPTCGAAFSSSSARDAHMVRAHVARGLRVTCPHCGQAFGNQAQLDRHLKATLYACTRYPDCDFTARTQAEVVKHYKGQTGEQTCRSEAQRLKGWRAKKIPECTGLRKGNYPLVTVPDDQASASGSGDLLKGILER